MKIGIACTFFPTLSLEHLDAAWFSISKQDFTDVERVYFLDNSSLYDSYEVQKVLSRYRIPVPLILEFQRHRDPSKAHSYSFNRVCKTVTQPWILFTRADCILDFDCLREFRLYAASAPHDEFENDLFVTSWMWQMAYDEKNNPVPNVDIEQYRWRELGAQALLQNPHGHTYKQTDLDTQVLFSKKLLFERAGWMNEKLSSWGFQQSEFQRAIRQGSTNVTFHVIPKHLVFHQFHTASRDFNVARSEWNEFGRI